MAERKFDYNAIGSDYKSMNSEFEVISQVLTQIDLDYKAVVNTGADDDALYGDLGSQLLLDWENVSSNFPNFITNFENWSAVVANASGNYAQFEQDMKGFKEVTSGSYLGVTAQKSGVTTAYTDSGVYSQYKARTSEQYASTAASVAGRTTHSVDLSNVTYETTDSQNRLLWHRIVGGTMVAGDVVSLLLIGTAAYGAATATESTALVPSGGGTSTAGLGSGGTAAIEGSSTPLLTGPASSIAQPLSGLADNIALTTIPTDSANFAAFQVAQGNLLSSISSAEALGAAYYTTDAATGVITFMTSSGGVVGTASASEGFVWSIAAGAAGL